MPKRIADKRLTDQNWDQEVDQEIPQQYVSRQADKSVLAARKIRVAKRTRPVKSNTASVFAGLSSVSAPEPSSNTGFSLGGFGTGNSLFGSKAPASSFKLDTKPEEQKSFGSGSSLFGTKAPSTFQLGVKKPEEQTAMSTAENADKTSDTQNVVSFGAKKDESAVPSSTEKPSAIEAPNASAAPATIEIQSEKPVKKAKIEEAAKKDARTEYNRHVTALNTGVIQWIKEHVDKMPTCDLSPVFQDYMRHFKDIEKKYPVATEEDSKKSLESESAALLSQPKPEQPIVIAGDQGKEVEKPKLDNAAVFSPKEKPSKPAFTGFGLSNKDEKTDEKEEPAFKGFIFNKKPEEKKTTDSPSLFGGFGLNKKPESESAVEKPAFTGFGLNKSTDSENTEKPAFKGFGLNKPADSENTEKPSLFKGFGSASDSKPAFGGFSFNKAPAATETAAVEENEPPKVESVEVAEEGSIFSKKCKLYYVLDGEYKDKGVGFLHLKKVSDEGKHQLVVRQDTALGTILLNVVLSNMPRCGRQGGKFVKLFCVPNPKVDGFEDGKMVPFMIKVKTAEDADEVMNIINEKIV